MKKLVTFIAATFISFNAAAGMVVIGNNAGVDALTSADVKRLFMGNSNQLGNGSRAQIVELVDGAAGRIAFHEVATGRSESQLQSGWARLVFTGKAEAPIQVADYSAVINQVASNANAIGYVDEAALTSEVKVLLKY
ncbi:phosphate ABC transporter substrate-binding protein [Vibrio sp. Isolate33]|uniref:phosphate ABC transporter substrate-binding protein n=1 Tax=Vibrio TaxID=662 RepID=UPI00159D237F|nr:MULTISPECIES: phosphate ABC transporter substrate-binding protein [Vibrio]MCG9542426.1 phosphate ABC transporter substrate-binding protein [Vibrio sp. Isolate33]NVN80974.1 phosphate ABC transporter substrate-binding protein [Vibrio sp. Scap16]QLE95234.1 phosphate ABC transporter substrate-binding protein [Vibrio sp. Scap24]